jgi:hypothetical protein
MYQTNLDTQLFCRKSLCRKLLQVSECGPRSRRIGPWLDILEQSKTFLMIHSQPVFGDAGLVEGRQAGGVLRIGEALHERVDPGERLRRCREPELSITPDPLGCQGGSIIGYIERDRRNKARMKK